MAFNFLGSIWFLWVPPILWSLFFEFWLYYARTLSQNSIEWVVLEVRIPREIIKTPKAMEQIFANLYGLRNAPTTRWEKYWDGEITLWFSFEITSFGGEIHFFIRTPKKRREAVEANIYAQYSDVEIVEANDYVNRLPLTTKELYREGFKMWGSEVILGKDDAYPIRTYPQFASAEETEDLDPISALFEVMGRLKKEEEVWLQILARPSDPKWKEKGDRVVQKLKAELGGAKTMDEEGGTHAMRTPGETDLLKAIESNISKQGFDTVIRYLYFAPVGIFDSGVTRSILAAFNQYSSMNLNYFNHNFKMRTVVSWNKFPYFFYKSREEARKQRVLKNYQSRKMPEDLFVGKLATSHIFNFNFTSAYFVLNTEELATIYHFPTNVVLTAPLIKKVESKKIGPPVGLPIFSEEDKLP